MSKIRLTSYTFDASAKTVTAAQFSDVTLAGIQMIVNVTDNIVIYNFADPLKGGSLATDTLTLDYDTTTMDDTDELMILCEDGLNQTVTAELSAVDNAVLDDIAADTEAIKTGVDGVEALLTTIETDTSAIQTAVELIDDAVATLGTTTYTEAVNKGLVVGAVRRDANTTLVGTTNEVAPLQVNATGELKVAQIQALPTGSNVIGGVTMAAHATTSPAKARDGAAGANDTGIPAFFVRRDTPTAVTPIAGDYEIPQISANGEQWVRLAGELADDAAFTLGTTRVVPNGAVAVNMDGTDPTAVSAEGDAAALRSDPNRILLVQQTHPRFFRASADYASAQTNASVVAAPGASLSLYITDIIISNGATAGNITLLDGSGGTVVLELYPAANGGLAHSFRNPIKLTANTALCITSTTVTTHTVTVTGYIAA